MTKLHKVEELPEWFLIASPSAFFSAIEVAKLFGFSSPVGLSSSIRKGAFPPPDNTGVVMTPYSLKERVMWSKKTIIEEIKRRNKAHDQ